METSKRLPLVELEKTQEYQRLTPKQRLFVATYCEAGLTTGKYDSVSACRTAYTCKTPEVARIMSYSLMSNIRIVAVLNRHFSTEPLQEFLMVLDRAISNNKLTVAQFNAMKLKGELMGFITRLPGTDKQATDAVPPSVLKAAKEARKAERKQPEKKPKEAPKNRYDDC